MAGLEPAICTTHCQPPSAAASVGSYIRPSTPSMIPQQDKRHE
jgi:hypothetical protein